MTTDPETQPPAGSLKGIPTGSPAGAGAPEAPPERPLGRLLRRLGRRAAPPDPLAGQEGGSAAGAALPARPGHNPYLAQRHEFHDRFYDLVKAKRNWQLACFAALAILGGVTAAYVRLASTSRITPYVVEVNALGVARAFGPADAVAVDDRVVTAELAEFVRNLRRVVADPVAQRDLLLEAYAFAGPEARRFLDAHFARPENDPRLLGRKLRRGVHLESVLRLPGSSSWRVRWVERTRPTAGGGAGAEAAWEALLAVEVVPPATAAEIEKNPLGVYVTDVNWGPVNAIQPEEDYDPDRP